MSTTLYVLIILLLCVGFIIFCWGGLSNWKFVDSSPSTTPKLIF